MKASCSDSGFIPSVLRAKLPWPIVLNLNIAGPEDGGVAGLPSPSQASRIRALAASSAHSPAGSESHVTPLPTPNSR
jgi:hypothetical protein